MHVVTEKTTNVLGSAVSFVHGETSGCVVASKT